MGTKLETIDTAKGKYLSLHSVEMTTGGQGVHREVESEGFAEKYRAVVEGSHPTDEPVGHRWGKVEPALWGRRRSHPPIVPRCVRTARYGRVMHDPRRAHVIFGWHQDKGPYKPKAKWETMSHESSDNRIVPQAWRKPCDSVRNSCVSWGRRLAKVVGTDNFERE